MLTNRLKLKFKGYSDRNTLFPEDLLVDGRHSADYSALTITKLQFSGIKVILS